MKNHVMIAAVAAFIFSVSYVGAANASGCKGMESSACSDNKSCYWVKGYTNKKGNIVKGHCRSKPGKAAMKSLKEKIKGAAQ